MNTLNLKMPGTFILPMSFALIYLLILIWFVPRFMILDSNLIAGCILAPFICKVNQSQRSWRFLIPAVATVGLALKLPVNSLFFIAMMFSLALLIENCIGKMSGSALFLLLLVSPVFKYALSMVDFPMRLWLTDKVVVLLNMMGTPALAEGNLIAMGKYEFTVDPACAGLNMLIISLIISLFLSMHFQKQTKRQIPFMLTLGLLALTLILNIISNYFRILLLVLFKIMPGTFFHDFTGLLCLLLYVIVPLMTGLKPLIIRFGYKFHDTNSLSQKNWYVIRFPLIHAIALLTLIFIATHMTTADELVNSNQDISLIGFHKKQLEGGILKFENEKALIYFKPAAYYIPGHDPKICWTGSGYLFQNIRKEQMNGFEVYTATLKKKNDLIYAAWWFDSGPIKTVDQVSWRWNSLTTGSKFYLVNVNAANKNLLLQQVATMLRSKNKYSGKNLVQRKSLSHQTP